MLVGLLILNQRVLRNVFGDSVKLFHYRHGKVNGLEIDDASSEPAAPRDAYSVTA